METVLIDHIYSPDIFELKFGSRTFIPLLEALLSSKGSVAEGYRAGELGSHQKVGKQYHPLAFCHCHLKALCTCPAVPMHVVLHIVHHYG